MIEFILNNKKVKTSAKSGMTLLDFIREEEQLKGTKIGCREGDCGACTVLVGSLENNEVVYKSITSCISPLGNAIGKHIVTIEGISLPKKLNVAQHAMAENFATQCGFCTPGFVVSMTGYALKKKHHSTCTDAISGNICRCTGYKSIENAIEDFQEERSSIIINNPLEELINKGFIPEYFKTIPKKLKELKNQKLKVDYSKKLVANGTDLYVRYADALSKDEVFLIGEDTALKEVIISDDIITLGASTTVTEIYENSHLNVVFPKLKSFLKLVSSEQIRNMGTLGGNFVNASPIGDMSVFFLALNSQLTIKNNNGNLRTILFKDFHQEYKKYDLQDDEIVQNIQFNIPKESSKFNFEKVSKRTHLDIATVNSACSILVENNTIKSVFVSIGGVAAIPKLLEKTSAYLAGKTVHIATLKQAATILQSEISPISDVRGTKDYKKLLARQLFFAHFVTLFPNKIALTDLV